MEAFRAPIFPAAADPPWRRRAEAAGRLILCLAILSLLTDIALIVLAAGDATLREALSTAVAFFAGAAALLSAAADPSANRPAWITLGLAILSFGCAFLVFFFLQKTLTTFPSPADFFWLGVYPFIVATIVLLIRAHRLRVSLDAAIVALALAAIGYDLLFDQFVHAAQASEVVGGQLAYSMLDFAVVLMLAFVCIPSRRRIGRAYLLLGAGMLLFLLGDLIVVKQISDGTYAPGTLLDVTWPTGVVLFALAPRFGTELEQVGRPQGSTLYVALVAPFLVALGLLVAEALNERNPAVMVLAGLALLLILLRLVASVNENERLARDNVEIVSAAGEGILRVDRRGRITFANPAALEVLGYSREDMLGERAHALIHHTRPNGSPYPATECPTAKTLTEGASQRITDELFWRKDGSPIAVDYTSAPVRSGGRLDGAVVVFDDVTHQREMKAQLRHQADHDSLTGLLNRRRFNDEVSDQLAYAERYDRPGVLLLVDLDSFKFVNDSYGHPVGDRLLCDVGAIIGGTLRETDIVARIGADEFAILLREAEIAEGTAVARDLIAAIRGRSEPNIGASVGIAPFDGGAELTPDELLVAADVALYEAKEAGGGAAVPYAGQSGQVLTWVERIGAALREDRLTVYAQPIVDLHTGQVAREELLVRMVDEHGDKIPPGTFLPAAERFGLINEIDLAVLEKAEPLAAGGIAVAINVSAHTLTDPRYLTQLERTLGTGIDPGLLTFEITETAAVANMADAQDFARRVQELGCSLALDDFGTGFSSFTYLKHIPAQYLKIDTEFIRELERNPADQHLVAAIVSIARGLGQKTVAEGIENAATLALVRKLGVDYAQGFHVGAPAPPRTAAATRERLRGEPAHRA
jgi:diguanylate cyclase (GGDEF)-like protein/PAS domain S-box-containing protein